MKQRGFLVGILALCCVTALGAGFLAQALGGTKGTKPTAASLSATVTESVATVGKAEVTEVPTARPEPTPTLAPADEITAAIVRALGDTNRGTRRVGRVFLAGDVLSVQWSINDNLTEAMIKSSARRDVAAMLESLDSIPGWGKVTFEGTFRLTDKFGNSEESPVVWVTFSRQTADRINWDSFVPENVYNIADQVKLHPAME